MEGKVKVFPTFNVSPGDSIYIVKYRIGDDSIPLETKILAIQNVANMETHNGITKDDFVASLRWIFDHYDF